MPLLQITQEMEFLFYMSFIVSRFYGTYFLKMFKMKNMHMNNEYIHITTLLKNFQVFAVLKKFKYGHFMIFTFEQYIPIVS
jgi:hypothetical protein